MSQDGSAHVAALERLRAWPRRSLANLPTPLRSTGALARRLGVSHLYVKMDADTNFALGGNKVRKLELELAPHRLEGVTHLVTAGGPQSNHCRVTAAAAARLGLGCVLVTQGPEPHPPRGNALLHRLFGAEIVTVEDRALRSPAMHRVAERIEAEGGTPRVIPIGASTGLGSLGYALAAAELQVQLDALDDDCRHTLLFTSASSCGTLAGLLLGFALLGRRDVTLFGVSADVDGRQLRETTLRLASEGAVLLACDVDLASVPLEVIDDQVGEGYGIPTPASDAALRRFARLEGIVLDPTYTSKAAAGMAAWLEGDPTARTERVVFLHTGGAPGLLA
ncbi:MAG: pyridoxal-phosphate dependent enzyme [Longimicrobiales bacterium]|nr:pyridoxal-phosphate dependent enzyme [Longimicrobiales bacterium]